MVMMMMTMTMLMIDAPPAKAWGIYCVRITSPKEVMFLCLSVCQSADNSKFVDEF